jgi:hypothetical protein
VAIAANSGATGGFLGDGFGDHVERADVVQELRDVETGAGFGQDAGGQGGSAMNASALDITIRTVAVVLCASERSSARVTAH